MSSSPSAGAARGGVDAADSVTGGVGGGNGGPIVAAVPRKRGETEMSVLKHKLENLGNKTSLRESGLSAVRGEHTVLYDHSISHSVSRGFTRSYLAKATGKLTALLNKPRLRTVDAVHGEQAELMPDEFKTHALTKMRRHEREREIMQARPQRIGWREKLAHAQVQRGIEERKVDDGRKRVSHEVSEANRAAMKRRGRDSDEGPDEMLSQQEERKALSAASTATTPFVAPAPSDFFISSAAEPEATTKVEMNEQTIRIRDLLDTHTSVTPGQSAPRLVANVHHHMPLAHKRAHTRFLSVGGATNILHDREHNRGMRRHAHGAEDGGHYGHELETLDETKESSFDYSSPAPQRPSSARLMRTSASTPSLRTGSQRARDAQHQQQDRWRHANGLHPTDMASAAATTLKMIPKLPIHQGLAAEDVRFTFEAVPPLFVDSHTALEIACAHVHFSHFKSRHKQVHYLLLSPDANYLCLVTFWWCFCTYFQSPTVEPTTPAILHELLRNMGKKYQELVRYLKIHLALKPSQRLNSWYDQFEGANNNTGEAGPSPSSRPQTSGSSSFNPFTCVPSYPQELFSDEMDRALAPKTRSGVHHQKERFLFLLPYVLASAIYELCFAFFPESGHFLTLAFRGRLERDLHRIYNGMELSEITLVAQRAKLMRESDVKQATPSMMSSAAAVMLQADDPNAVPEKPSFESLFAFNSQVNSSATRPGAKFHEAILNPHHSSVPGSPWITTSAKRLASQTSMAHSAAPTPLTRHTRIGGVMQQQANGEGDSSPEKEPLSGMSFSGASASFFTPARTSPEKPQTAVITSERAFNFGVAAAAAGAAALAERVAAFSPKSSTATRTPLSPLAGSFGLTSGSASVGVSKSRMGSPLPADMTSAQHAAIVEEKLRRRARERPVKGSLHSTGDWSRDERERRDFLQRMKARHDALERENKKERSRIELRERRIEEGGERVDGLGFDADEHGSVSIASEHDVPWFEEDDDEEPDAAVEDEDEGDTYDPISSAFASVMGRRFDEVASTVNPTVASVRRSPSKHTLQASQAQQQQRGMGKSASMPVLGSPGGGLSIRLEMASPSRDGLNNRRPAALSIPSALSVSMASPGVPMTALTDGPLSGGSRPRRRPLDRFVPQAVALDIEAADGFTASDLCLPLQSILLTEENLRHAQKLRPPQIRLNLNALSLATGVSLGMRTATSAWGNGIVLKHSNPIPREQLGEDLHDGFAYEPKPSALAMNSIEYTTDADAQASQARLLSQYKHLHALQLQENRLKHGGANLEHGEIGRGVHVHRSASRSSLGGGASESESTNTYVAPLSPHFPPATMPSTPSMPPVQRTITFSTPSLTSAAAPAAAGSSSTTASPFKSPALGPACAPSPALSSVSASGGPPKKRSLHKPSKLDALLANAKQVHWSSSSAHDDPSVFLTPRTKAILAAVEGNAERHREQQELMHEEEMKALHAEHA